MPQRIPRSILLVRLRLIGDVVFTTPAIRAVRRRYPDARLVYLVEEEAAPVVQHNPHLDEVIVVAHTRGGRRVADDLALARRLWRDRFDLVIDFHGGPRSAWLTWVTRAPVRVGYDVAGRRWMYSRVVHRPRALRARHSVENQWDLLAAVDDAFATGPSPEHDRVEMPVDDEARRRVDGRLAAGPAATAWIVMHVSAGNPFRRWPEASFADLAAALVRGDAGRAVIITGGPSDRDAATRVIATARATLGALGTRVVDGDGLSLADLRALVDRAALFVGGDSGPLHVASTSETPIVGLYGPTLAERSRPWRPERVPAVAVDAGELPCRPCDQRVCAPGDFRCLTRVSAAAVYEAAERLLEVRR
jgi:predicted lipopolysaccharide heptosyltransferase III